MPQYSPLARQQHVTTAEHCTGPSARNIDCSPSHLLIALLFFKHKALFVQKHSVPVLATSSSGPHHRMIQMLLITHGNCVFLHSTVYLHEELPLCSGAGRQVRVSYATSGTLARSTRHDDGKSSQASWLRRPSSMC